MSSSVVTMTPAPHGHCSRCGKVWTLETEQGVCQWCGKLAVCQNQSTQPRSIKSSSRRRQRQAPVHSNGYGHLEGEWLTYYNVASRFADKVRAQDKEDILHDIILTLAVAERNNGHEPFTEGTMYRIASRTVADYWRSYYKHTNGLDCHGCSKAQRQKCRSEDLYRECPKAIKLGSLNKPVLDDEGNLTELGELIADPKSLDLDAWDRDSLWQMGYKPRLVAIALKLHRGEALNDKDRQYLSYWRRGEQKKLFDFSRFDTLLTTTIVGAPIMPANCGLSGAYY